MKSGNVIPIKEITKRFQIIYLQVNTLRNQLIKNWEIPLELIDLTSEPISKHERYYETNRKSILIRKKNIIKSIIKLFYRNLNQLKL